MKYLFKPQIKNWQDWLAVYQNVPEFLPLIQAVFRRENLKLKSFAECMSGTHFVARFGNMVIKIYAIELGSKIKSFLHCPDPENGV